MESRKKIQEKRIVDKAGKMGRRTNSRWRK